MNTNMKSTLFVTMSADPRINTDELLHVVYFKPAEQKNMYRIIKQYT
jgi:hypothetical protein